ncbi:glycosyltransferase, partial [Enterobacter hormaechei]|nr:glycosyltransferase [Enterobacter hormaechei]
MTTQRPLISIYMPTWNRQQLAIRAIKSVLRQDYDNWELIIVDDCSSSYEQLQKFVEDLNDPRVVYTHNAINSGACAVRNQAIMQAKGQYLTGIDDDDEWTPNRLS